MSSKLNVIREKCIEANPDIEKREELYHPEGMGLPKTISIFCPIRLADVLLAIGDKLEGEYTNNDGVLTFLNQNDPLEEPPLWNWNLHDDDLSHQSPETIEFIYSLLT